MGSRSDTVEDQSRILALFLLHELGHIHNGDTSSYFVRADDKSLNLEGTAQKDREEAADQFAANQVAQAMHPEEKDYERFVAAQSVALTLIGVQFRVSTQALLDDFGRRSPSRFWDQGYSHPNFERRLIVLLDEIQPSVTSRQLLRDFDENRKATLAPQVLFKATTNGE